MEKFKNRRSGHFSQEELDARSARALRGLGSLFDGFTPQKYRELLTMIGRILGRNRRVTDPEDVFQDALLRILGILDRVDPEQNYRGLLYKIVRNRALSATVNAKRYSVKYKQIMTDDDGQCHEFTDSSQLSPDALAASAEIEQVLKTELLKLPPEEKDFVYRRFFLEQTLKETTVDQDCSTASAFRMGEKIKVKLKIAILDTAELGPSTETPSSNADIGLKSAKSRNRKGFSTGRKGRSTKASVTGRARN